METYFTTIRHRPQTKQFVASNIGGIVAAVVIFLVSGCDGLLPGVLVPFMLCLLVFFIALLTMRYLNLMRMRFVISGEQMRFEYGIFSLRCDYIELYRVVDYSEQRSFFQQLLGIKTVSIYSGDKTCPRLDIIGVPQDMDLIRMIRERVEYNKRIANIHEFTNR